MLSPRVSIFSPFNMHSAFHYRFSNFSRSCLHTTSRYTWTAMLILIKPPRREKWTYLMTKLLTTQVPTGGNESCFKATKINEHLRKKVGVPTSLFSSFFTLKLPWEYKIVPDNVLLNKYIIIDIKKERKKRKNELPNTDISIFFFKIQPDQKSYFGAYLWGIFSHSRDCIELHAY